MLACLMLIAHLLCPLAQGEQTEEVRPRFLRASEIELFLVQGWYTPQDGVAWTVDAERNRFVMTGSKEAIADFKKEVTYLDRPVGKTRLTVRIQPVKLDKEFLSTLDLRLVRSGLIGPQATPPDFVNYSIVHSPETIANVHAAAIGPERQISSVHDNPMRFVNAVRFVWKGDLWTVFPRLNGDDSVSLLITIQARREDKTITSAINRRMHSDDLLVVIPSYLDYSVTISAQPPRVQKSSIKKRDKSLGPDWQDPH